MKRLFLLLLLLSAVSCESVRTVYDANGKKIDPDQEPQGGEKDLMSHFEGQFAESFKEEKNDEGVPVTRSNRVSSFQKDIDAARKEDKEYTTKAFGGKNNDLRAVDFAGKKEFAGKTYDRGNRTAFSTDSRPDFMNESHGIDPNRRFRSEADDRSPYEARILTSRDREFVTGESRYNGGAPNGYVETRRDRTPPPDITDFKDYYRKSIQDTKKLLNRDGE